MPEKESDHLTPATRLLEKRREMTEVEQALATQKEVCESDANADSSLNINFLAITGIPDEDGNPSTEKR
jgi:hypothetical protein